MKTLNSPTRPKAGATRRLLGAGRLKVQTEMKIIVKPVNETPVEREERLNHNYKVKQILSIRYNRVLDSC